MVTTRATLAFRRCTIEQTPQTISKTNAGHQATIHQMNLRQLFLLILLLIFGTRNPAAQEVSDGAPRYRALRRELIRMGHGDQLKRFSILVKKQDEIDKKNLNDLNYQKK